MNKFKFKLFTQADPQAQYDAVAVKDPMTFYLLNTGIGYLGEVKLFDATSEGPTLVQAITDEGANATDIASTKAIAEYVAAKVSAIDQLSTQFFRAVKYHTLTADDLANENIVVPDDASEGDVGLLFTADFNGVDDDNETWYFISLMGYLSCVYSFVSGKTVTLTVNPDNSVTAEVKIADAETALKSGDDGLFLEKTATIDTANPTDKLVTESALVTYLQDVLSQVVTYSVDDETDE